MRRRVMVLLAIALAVLALAWRPVSAHVRAAALLQRFQQQGAGKDAEVDERPLDLPVTTEGPTRARLYAPRHGHGGALVLVPGVHHLGIDEPRLVRFARALAAAGVTTLTPEVKALTEYRIEGASAGTIGAAAHALRALTGARVGLMGMSFAGGMALLAASDPRFAEDVSFVVAVGAHDDLARVARFFATSEIARPDGSVLHLAAHPYGALVLVYDYVDDFFPEEDAGIARDAIRLQLWEEKARAHERAEELPPGSRARLEALFDGKLDGVAPQILVEIDAHSAAMAAASPHGALGRLSVPVLLLHGAGDTVIPPTETLWLAQDVPKKELDDVLISPALVHVELEGEPPLREKWALVHFMAEVLERGE